MASKLEVRQSISSDQHEDDIFDAGLAWRSPPSARRRLLSYTILLIVTTTLILTIPSPFQTAPYPSCNCDQSSLHRQQQTKTTGREFEFLSEMEDLTDTPESRSAWDHVTNDVSGFIFVDDPAEALSEGVLGDMLDGPKNESGVPSHPPLVVGISMFHQLHCLGIIRDAFIRNLKRNGDGGDGDGAGEPHTQRDGHQHSHGDHEDLSHIGHCFSYIAQGISCAGDTTLEPPLIATGLRDDGGAVVLVNGENVTHQCRDTSKARSVIRASEVRSVGGWFWETEWRGASVEEIFPAGEL